MFNIKNMRLIAKITCGFAGILILLGVVAYVGYNGMTGEMSRVNKTEGINQIVNTMYETQQAEANFISSNQQADSQQVETLLTEMKKQAETTRQTFTGKENQDHIAQMIAAINTYSDAFQTYKACGEECRLRQPGHEFQFRGDVERGHRTGCRG